MATKKNTSVKSKSGTVYEYFRITKTIGHKYVNGKKTPIRKAFYGTSKKNAEKKYEQWKDEQREKKEAAMIDTRSFGELLDYYCENILMVNSKYEITTRVKYREVYERYVKNDQIAKIGMTHLSSYDIQQFYNKININSATMTQLHCFMLGFFKWSTLNKLNDDVLAGVVIPDKRTNRFDRDERIMIWTDDEIANIMACEPDHKFKPLIIFALYSGLRISELLGLKWSDLYDDTIHVRRQYCRGYWKNPKQNEKRDVPIHKKIKECVENMDNKNEIIFSHEDGSPLLYTTVMNNLDRFYKRNNIPHKKFHAYRSTFCTNLCRKGVPLQTIAKLAGHKSIEVTAKYYAAVSFDEQRDAISKL